MLIIKFNAKHMSGSELNYSHLCSSFVLILVVVIQLLSYIWLTLWPHGLQHTRFTDPLQSPKFCCNSCALSQWCHPTISFSIDPFSSCPQSSQYLVLLQWVGCSHQMAKLLELQHESFQWIFSVDFLYNWPILSPCCPEDSQESFPAPQFECINSLMPSLLYHPTLTFHTWLLEKP